MNAVVPMPQQAVANRERKTAWQRELRRKFKEANGYSTTAHYGAGGNRAAVLQRDGFACVKCGMTDREHIEKWNRPITIDHKDKDRSNNAMTNLQTLCLTCHGNKDLIPRLRERKTAQHMVQMLELRSAGKTYQQIADATGLSIGAVYRAIIVRIRNAATNGDNR